VRCVLLTAEGKAFSFGGDLVAVARDIDNLALNMRRQTLLLHAGIGRLQRLDAPIVAAVQGACAGGTASMVAGCDVVVAAANARFVPAYVTIGFACDGGGSVFYARRMGLARARHYLLMNEPMKAEAALAAGLVDEVTAPELLLDRAEEIARKFATGPTRAYGEIRRLFLGLGETAIEGLLELETQAMARAMRTHDAVEGVQAFLAKRPAQFLGR
jgi:2-(1,2-epoxy-1,2-dihydrophenyl)acetyl-CoA isomerase